VTAKDDPKDVDGCWEYDPNGTDPDLLDPVFLDLDPPRQAMKSKYGVDFLIQGVALAETGQTVEEFFQVDREGNRKGIIVVELLDNQIAP